MEIGKKIFIAIMIVSIGGFLIYFLNNSKKSLAFDLDISSLSYSLPAHTNICLPEKKEFCKADGGCEYIKPTVFLLYNEPFDTLYRCDDKPCEGYLVNRTQDDSFIYLEPVPPAPEGLSVRISYYDDYVETVNFGPDTLVSYGKCE